MNSMRRPSTLTETADAGLSFVAPAGWTPAYAPMTRFPIPNTGFTAPTITYDLMRQIQARAQALDLLVNRYVADPVFRSSWGAWYEQAWEPFFEKYTQSELARLGAAFYSDELAQRAETFRQQLESFYADYNRQRQPDGQAVPNAGQPVPQVRPLPKPEGGSLSSIFAVPWWTWVIGGVVVVGLGYVAYRYLTAPLKILGK